jgi:hypothetical protein
MGERLRTVCGFQFGERQGSFAAIAHYDNLHRGVVRLMDFAANVGGILNRAAPDADDDVSGDEAGFSRWGAGFD